MAIDDFDVVRTSILKVQIKSPLAIDSDAIRMACDCNRAVFGQVETFGLGTPFFVLMRFNVHSVKTEDGMAQDAETLSG